MPLLLLVQLNRDLRVETRRWFPSIFVYLQEYLLYSRGSLDYSIDPRDIWSVMLMVWLFWLFWFNRFVLVGNGYPPRIVWLVWL